MAPADVPDLQRLKHMTEGSSTVCIIDAAKFPISGTLSDTLAVSICLFMFFSRALEYPRHQRINDKLDGCSSFPA